MTKRLISLMLAVLMLACTLASCGTDKDALDNTVEQASRYTSTINLWMVTESKLVQKAGEMLFAGLDPDQYPKKETEQTEEQKTFLASLGEELEETWRQLDDIQDELNVLTKKRFKTKVNIRYFVDEAGEDGYYAKVEKAFGDIEAAKNNGLPFYPELTDEETVKNEYGIPELKYPTALDFQVDVLFVGGAANYYKFADNGWIAPLDELIPNSAVQLTYHLTPALLSAAKYNGKTYAIPNNSAMGEYTYIAVDTELLKTYYGDAAKMNNSLYSAEMSQFLKYVKESDNGVYPIYSENGKLDLELMHYWSYGTNGSYYIQQPGTFSLFGGFYSATDAQGAFVSCENLLKSEAYRKNLATKLQYEGEGYVTGDANAKAAVRIEKGGYAKMAELEGKGYTVLKVDAPRITDEDVFGGMFAVGASTQDKNRALEIIAMLNTESEIRNLLQYGIEGTNYALKSVLDKDNNVIGTYAEMMPDNMYWMDLAKTGNMFVAYPNAAESDVANGKYGIEEWENAKLQNLEALIYPTTGLAITGSYYTVDDDSVRILNVVSAKMKAILDEKMQAVLDAAKAYNEASTEEKANALQAKESAWAAFEAIFAGAKSTNDLAQWILDQTGDLSYRPAGSDADKLILVMDLTIALGGMEDVYNESAPAAKGSKQSVNVLYQKWRYDNFVSKNG